MSTYRIIRSDFESGLPSYGAEARTLFYWAAEEICGLKASALVPCLDKAVGEAEAERFSETLERLKRNEPIQYIFGRAYFYGLELKVDPRVLIPRPETEELVAWAVETLHAAEPAPAHFRILDLCTGSGAIAIALSKAFPQAEVRACDISEPALQVAKHNAAACHTRVDFFQCDILRAAANPAADSAANIAANPASDAAANPTYHLIISNPPYVRPSEKAAMRANVLDYEPATALFVPEDDPLLFYNAIARYARNCLAPQGILMLEVNEAFGGEIQQLLSQTGFREICLRNDLRNKPRMILAVN